MNKSFIILGNIAMRNLALIKYRLTCENPFLVLVKYREGKIQENRLVLVKLKYVRYGCRPRRTKAPARHGGMTNNKFRASSSVYVWTRTRGYI